MTDVVEALSENGQGRQVEDSRERECCRDRDHWISSYGKHPLSPLLYNRDIRLFFPEEPEQGCLGYFVHQKIRFVIGGLLCAPERKPALLDAWLTRVKRQGKITVFLHADPEDYRLLAERGYYINRIGSSYSIDLRKYSLAGKRFQQLRNKVNKSRKAGVTVRLIDNRDDFFAILPEMKRINSEWLADKKTKLLKHLVTGFSGIRIPSSRYRLLVAEREGQLLGYIVYSRVLSAQSGWFHDLSRKRTDTPNGVMQAINVEAMEIIRRSEEENADWLHFGFTPLADIPDPDSVSKELQSPVFASVVGILARHGGVVYPARTQRQYKMGWRPQQIEPEYFAFPKGKAMKSLWGLLRATNSL
ncbi:DUF2156 domain-containing protein [Endozoicomonas sp. 4G]|uniref:bifunctional lysylphosphatidylglycerol flippase/synthetase MprF n=1 Tax=Endozoicomonas sp. 4G TaxID=2872754 RepID=UPI0020788351|nr:DUF2156 domain-containing protein [Endozoicomonas sp. 4G]